MLLIKPHEASLLALRVILKGARDYAKPQPGGREDLPSSLGIKWKKSCLKLQSSHIHTLFWQPFPGCGSPTLRSVWNLSPVVIWVLGISYCRDCHGSRSCDGSSQSSAASTSKLPAATENPLRYLRKHLPYSEKRNRDQETQGLGL